MVRYRYGYLDRLCLEAKAEMRDDTEKCQSSRNTILNTDTVPQLPGSTWYSYGTGTGTVHPRDV